MDIKKVFRLPKPVNVTGRTSSITNSFVNGIIPSIMPTETELTTALNILGMDESDVNCAYCGDKYTEWDHLRPLVKNKKPTGFISDIYNLVPSCGKCNQSKGNKDWEKWMTSDAELSPKTRKIKDLNVRISRLEKYSNWKTVEPIDFEKIVGKEDWEKHWQNCENLYKMMSSSQQHANIIKQRIAAMFVVK